MDNGMGNGTGAEMPFNSVPGAVLIIAALMAVVELALSLGASGMIGGPGAVGWRADMVTQYGLRPRVLPLAVQGDAGLWVRFISYPFVHGTFTHALFVVALWVALGKFVGDLYHPFAVVAIFVVATLGGGVVFALAGGAFGFDGWLFGGYPPVYGLIGAFTYVMWLRLGQSGGNQIAAFRLIGVLMGLQLVFGLLFGSDETWIADLAGFACGMALAPFVAQGGWSAFLRRMRGG